MTHELDKDLAAPCLRCAIPGRAEEIMRPVLLQGCVAQGEPALLGVLRCEIIETRAQIRRRP